MKKRALEGLTGVRFIAAVYVLAFHCFTIDHWETLSLVGVLPTPAAHLLDRGSMAVSLFFVLSGFILAYNYSSPAGGMACSKHDFWVARFARIWPMYLVGMVVALPCLYHASSVWNLAPSETVARSAVVIIANFFLLNAWWVQLNELNPPGWSLSAETFFYLVFPFALRPLGKLSSRQLLGICAVLYLLALIPPSVYSLGKGFTAHFYDTPGVSPHDLAWLYASNYMPPSRLPEFLIGMSIGIIFDRHPLAGQNSILCNSDLAAGVLLVALMTVPWVPWPILHSSFFAPFCAWLVWTLAIGQTGVVTRLFSTDIFQLLGQASYGFYLIHYPILRYLDYAMVHFIGIGRTVSTVAGLFVVTFALTTSASIFLFYVVEEPGRKFLRRALTTDHIFLRSLRRE